MISSLNPLALGGSGLEPNHLIILLLYFGLGFWLLSQAKLMEMNARWLVNGINKEDQIGEKLAEIQSAHPAPGWLLSLPFCPPVQP